MRGYFGIGCWHPKYEQNIGTLFRSAVAFGAAYVFTVGRRYRKQASDTGNAMGVIPLYHFKDMDDLKKHLPVGCPCGRGTRRAGGAPGPLLPPGVLRFAPWGRGPRALPGHSRQLPRGCRRPRGFALPQCGDRRLYRHV